jgi:hypothetical protein
MWRSASPTVISGVRRTNSVVMIPPAVCSGYRSRLSTSARTSVVSMGSKRPRPFSPISLTMSVRWSDESARGRLLQGELVQQLSRIGRRQLAHVRRDPDEALVEPQSDPLQ